MVKELNLIWDEKFVFETLEQDRVREDSDPASDWQVWSRASRTANTPWLHTEVAYPIGGEEVWDVWFLNGIDDLQGILKDPRIKLRQLDLVSRKTPGSRWFMFKVKRVWELHSKSADCWALELISGEFILPAMNWIADVDEPNHFQRLLKYAFD